MKKILRIISSPQGEASVSKKLGNTIVEKLIAKYPESTLLERNLADDKFPHLNQLQISSWFTAAEHHSPEQAAAIKLSDDAIAELQEANVYVIDAPLYNFAITSTLKAYLDHIARPGITFRYTEHGPEGFLKNKKAYIAISSGGIYSEGAFQPFDFISPYLKFLLGFLGVTDISFVRAEGLNVEGVKQTALQKGLESIVID